MANLGTENYAKWFLESLEYMKPVACTGFYFGGLYSGGFGAQGGGGGGGPGGPF